MRRAAVVARARRVLLVPRGWRGAALVVAVGAALALLLAAAAAALAVLSMWRDPGAALGDTWRGDPSRRSDVAYVTAASANHFALALLLLDSIFARERPLGMLPRVIFYDLGLAPEQAAWLRRAPGVEVRAFPFDRYPPHFALAAYSYAWKPALLNETLTGDAETVVWLDAGNRIGATPIAADLPRVRGHSGLLTRWSGGDLRLFTHPGMLRALRVRDDDNATLAMPNCDGAFLVLMRNATLRPLVQPWLACALDAACIVPPGSSSRNHRQDQAALSVLVTQLGPTHGFTCQGYAPSANATASHCEDRLFPPNRASNIFRSLEPLVRYRFLQRWAALAWLADYM